MIYLILILALIFRIIALDQSFWLDEAIGALAIRDFSYTQIISDFIVVDNHPPLYYLILKLWSQLLGYSEISLRMLSVLFGVGTVYLAWQIARAFKKKSEQFLPLLTALLLATSQIHVYYSQEARMYSMTAFFVALAAFAFLRLFKKKVKAFDWTLFSVSVIFMAFTDYPPVYLFPLFPAYAIYKRKSKDWFIKFLLSFTPLIILGIVWLPYFIQQSLNGSWLINTLPQWKTVGGGATAKQAILVWMKFTLGRITLVDKITYYLLVAISSIPFFVSLYNSAKKWKENFYFWLWLLLPLLFGFLSSFIFPAFIYFRFVYVLPAFYFLLARGALRSKFAGLVIGGLLAVNLSGLFIYYSDVDKLQQREQWRQAVEFIEGKADEDTVVIFGYPEPTAPYRWYEEGTVETVGVTDSIAPDSVKTSINVSTAVEGKEEVYFFEYLTGISNPVNAIRDQLSTEGFVLSEKYGQFSGLGFIEKWESTDEK